MVRDRDANVVLQVQYDAKKLRDHVGVAVSAQRAGDNLDPAEKMVVGGPFSVPATTPATAARRSAAPASARSGAVPTCGS